MRVFAALVVLLLASACASSRDPQGEGAEGDLITASQAIETGASTVLDVVRDLRPSWLPPRPGIHILVCVEGGRWGETPKECQNHTEEYELDWRNGVLPYEDQYYWLLREMDWRGVSGIRWVRRAQASPLQDAQRRPPAGELLGAIVISYAN